MTKSQDILTIEEYSADQFVQLTWAQYGKILDNLYKKILAYSKKHQVTFDVIVPILRGGGILGTFLAGKLKILRIVPVQYKYFIHGKQVYLKKLLPLSSNLKLKANANILVAENCYCFGTTTKAVIEEIKAKYPKAKIYVAADRMDYTYREVKGAEAVFCGEFNNDCKKLTPKQCKKLHINATQYYYPWETLDEEIAACQLKQYKYKDLIEAEKDAETYARFDFSK